MSACLTLSPLQFDESSLGTTMDDAVILVLNGLSPQNIARVRFALIEDCLSVEDAVDHVTATSSLIGSVAERVEYVLQQHIDPADNDPTILIVQSDGTIPRRTDLEFPLLTIRARQREVFVQGQSISLTKGAFDLLQVLASHPGEVLSREELTALSKGNDYPATLRAIDVQIAEVRRKLGVARSYIQTVRGVGYRFDARDSVHEHR